MTSIPPNIPSSHKSVAERPANHNLGIDFSVHLRPLSSIKINEDFDLPSPEECKVASSDCMHLMTPAQTQPGIVKESDAVTDRAQPGIKCGKPEFVSVDRHDQYVITEITGKYKREVLSAPWRLLPGYGLNYLITDGRHITNDSGNSLVNRDPAIRKINGLFQFESIVPAALMEFRTKHQTNAGAVATCTINNESGYDSIKETADARNNHAIYASAFQWVKQLLHLTLSFDGQHTVWIRDYALTEEQISEVISIITKAASECAFDLERIMVNGHEMWSKQYAGNYDGGTECK